jgi:hypothetical protein
MDPAVERPRRGTILYHANVAWQQQHCDALATSSTPQQLVATDATGSANPPAAGAPRRSSNASSTPGNHVWRRAARRGARRHDAPALSPRNNNGCAFIDDPASTAAAAAFRSRPTSSGEPAR